VPSTQVPSTQVSSTQVPSALVARPDVPDALDTCAPGPLEGAAATYLSCAAFFCSELARALSSSARPLSFAR